LSLDAISNQLLSTTFTNMMRHSR